MRRAERTMERLQSRMADVREGLNRTENDMAEVRRMIRMAWKKRQK